MAGDGLTRHAATHTRVRGSTAISQSQISRLAEIIRAETRNVESYFHENGLVLPCFEVDSSIDFHNLPTHISRSRQEVIQATQELKSLMLGPKESVRWMAWDFMNTQSLQLINYFRLAHIVPSNCSITLQELQQKVELDATNLKRVIRYAITNHVFQEPEPGVITHTAASRLLAQDKQLKAWVGLNTEDIYPASAHVIDALKEYPEATSPLRTGFNIAFNTIDKEPMFATFGKDAKRAKRMGLAMNSLTGGEGYEVSYLVHGYDFSDVDATGGMLVDIGGSHGFVCVELARRYRNMQFVVQDLPKTVDSAPRPIYEDPQVAKRITFEAHDFFTEQPRRGADVYFFRWIMHNHSTVYAVQILRNLIPALRPGSRVIINEICLQEPGTEEPWDNRLMRGMDLVMMTLLNAQERDEREFRELFEMASKDFVFKGVTRPGSCRMSIIEAIWQPNKIVDAPLT